MRQPIGLIPLNCLYRYSQQGLRIAWDSNPRTDTATGFQDQHLQPLGHLSINAESRNWTYNPLDYKSSALPIELFQRFTRERTSSKCMSPALIRFIYNWFVQLFWNDFLDTAYLPNIGDYLTSVDKNGLLTLIFCHRKWQNGKGGVRTHKWHFCHITT